MLFNSYFLQLNFKKMLPFHVAPMRRCLHDTYTAGHRRFDMISLLPLIVAPLSAIAVLQLNPKP